MVCATPLFGITLGVYIETMLSAISHLSVLYADGLTEGYIIFPVLLSLPEVLRCYSAVQPRDITANCQTQPEGLSAVKFCSIAYQLQPVALMESYNNAGFKEI